MALRPLLVVARTRPASGPAATSRALYSSFAPTKSSAFSSRPVYFGTHYAAGAGLQAIRGGQSCCSSSQQWGTITGGFPLRRVPPREPEGPKPPCDHRQTVRSKQNNAAEMDVQPTLLVYCGSRWQWPGNEVIFAHSLAPCSRARR